MRKIINPRKNTISTINLEEIDNIKAKINHQPVFVVGTGRCGTHFICKVMEKDSSFLSVHFDSINPVSDSFLRYCIWNKLPVDIMPFKDFRYRIIAYASRYGKIYFEANVYLSLISRFLYEWFNAKIILLIRKPQDVVNSHFVKGWYKKIPIRGDLKKVPGFPPEMNANYYFGRILPKGQDYVKWQKLTQIGKISWVVNTLNLNVFNQLQEMPEKSYRIVKLEEFDYEQYKELHSFCGGQTPILPKQFEKLRQCRPGKGTGERTTSSWTRLEWHEFQKQTEEARKVFGYSVD